MTNEEMLLQTLGTNEDAKTTLANILTEYFPSVVSELSLPARIVEKFYDWQFPFIYTTDGAGTRKWSVSVRALCERNPKLADLDAFFNASGTDGTFQETYGGNDTETNTDNSARRTKTEFNGVDDPTSQSTSESIVVEPVEGKNTTERKTEYGKTRTYADGRTWSQILADVMDTRGPVYLFINSFAQILREPADDPCDMPVYPPSMQMKVNVNTIPAGDPATASVTNQGTLYNAIFDVLFNIPQGERGIEALMSTYTLTKESDPNVNDKVTITAENFPTYFSRDPAIDDRCIFVAKNTSTGESFILGATCTTKRVNYAVFTVVSVISTAQDLSNYAQIDGNYPNLGAGYLAKEIYFSNGPSSGRYFKACSFTSPKKATSNSFIFLINGIYGDQSIPYAEESGIIELDVRSNKDGVVSSQSGLTILAGNLKSTEFFVLTSADLSTIDFYIYIPQQYGSLRITELSASDRAEDVVFDGTRYSTAPEGAVYAVNRNMAAYDGEGNPISKTYAKLASPAFTGTPTAPTPATHDNSTKIATTAFVQSVFESSGGGSALYEHSFIFSHDNTNIELKYIISFSVVSTRKEPAENFKDIIDMCGPGVEAFKSVKIPASGGVYTNSATYPIISANINFGSIYYITSDIIPVEMSFYQASLGQVNEPLDADSYSIRDLRDGSIIYLK